MTYKLTIGAVMAAAFLALSAYFLVSGQRPAEASVYNATILKTATTSTAYSVTSTASLRILATTTNANGDGNSFTRVYATICNPNSTVVALNMNNDRAVSASSSTFFIGAAAGYNACFEITDRNLYQGSVQASSTNATVGVFVTSFVQ